MGDVKKELNRAEAQKLYHGTTEKIQGDFRFPLYLTPNKDYAQVYAGSTAASSLAHGKKNNDGPMVHEFQLKPDARVFEATNPEHMKMIEDYWPNASMSGAFYPGSSGHLDWTEGDALAEWIKDKKLPFDAIKLDEGGGGNDPGTGVYVPSKGQSILALNKESVLPNKVKEALELAAAQEDPLAQLKQEALKYKSADEFAKAQGDQRFHGGTPYDVTRVSDGGISLTSNKNYAKDFSQGGMGGNFTGRGVVNEVVIDPKAKILPTNKIPSQFVDSEGHMQDVPDLLNYAKQRGYDGVDLSRFGEGEIRVFNPAVLKTKQQLTDLYHQAHSEAGKGSDSKVAKTLDRAARAKKSK